MIQGAIHFVPVRRHFSDGHAIEDVEKGAAEKAIYQIKV
jgi:hypothetical protein